MPRIQVSTTPNLNGWTPRTVTPPPPTSVEMQPTQRSAFMHAAMPVLATTADSFVRQFYGQSSIPQVRILPAQRRGTP